MLPTLLFLLFIADLHLGRCARRRILGSVHRALETLIVGLLGHFCAAITQFIQLTGLFDDSFVLVLNVNVATNSVESSSSLIHAMISLRFQSLLTPLADLDCQFSHVVLLDFFGDPRMQFCVHTFIGLKVQLGVKRLV